MKKGLSLILVFTLCLSLCACSKKLQLHADDVKNALNRHTGTLNIEGPEDDIESFSYVVEGVNAEDLLNKEYSRNAIAAVLSGNTSECTINQIRVSYAIFALMSIDNLLNNTDDDKNFNSDTYIEKVLNIICDGKKAKYNGWIVSTAVDINKDSITINVVS